MLINRLCLTSIVVMLTSTTVYAQNSLSAAETDWQIQHNKLDPNSYCQGAYIEPPINELDESYIEADSSVFTFDEYATLEGNIVVKNNKQQINADHGQYEIDKQRLTLEGNIAVRGKGLLLKGDKAVIGTDATTGLIHNASYLLHNAGARGKAKSIERTGKTSIKLTEGIYTQCNPKDNTWLVTADSISLNYDTGQGLAKNAKVKIKGIPVLAIPYMPFPIGDNRRSGFLWPAVSSVNNASGLDIAIPYYWNINPQSDATVTPRIVGDRGEGIETEVRHLNTVSEWQISGAYFTDNINNKDRWLANIEEQGQFGNNWYHKIDISRVSDNDYFKDYDVSSLDIKRSTHLVQQGQLSYWGNKSTASLTIKQYQTIEDSIAQPYETVPQFSWQTLSLGKHAQLAPIALIDYNKFDTKTQNLTTGSRLYYELGAELPFTWEAGFVKTQTKVRGINYDLDTNSITPNAPTSIDVSSATASIDAGLIFERYNNNKTISLEPRLYYLYSDYEDQSTSPIFDTRLATETIERRFSDTRFSGYDRLDNANELTLGLTNRWYNTNKREVFSTTVAQTFYFDDKRIQESTQSHVINPDEQSNIIAGFTWQPTSTLSGNTHLIFDKNLHSIKRGNWRISYADQQGMLLSVSQVYNRNETKQDKVDQTEVSVAWPVAKQWTLYAQHHYDLANKRDVQNTLGFEYQSCCWMMRGLYQQSLSNDDFLNKTESGFFIQFELKGLGGTGATTTNILRDAIYGFKE